MCHRVSANNVLLTSHCVDGITMLHATVSISVKKSCPI